jgi:hypothetical protein
MAHLTMYDVRDLDLMLRMRDEANNDGEITAQELADALGISDDMRNVAIRLAWMRRYGMLTYNPERHGWSLAAGGERVIAAKAKAAVADRIDKVPDEQLVDVMAHVTTRYRYGDPVIATMLRREFAYGTSPRSQVWARNGRRRG